LPNEKLKELKKKPKFLKKNEVAEEIELKKKIEKM